MLPQLLFFFLPPTTCHLPPAQPTSTAPTNHICHSMLITITPYLLSSSILSHSNNSHQHSSKAQLIATSSSSAVSMIAAMLTERNAGSCCPPHHSHCTTKINDKSLSPLPLNTTLRGITGAVGSHTCTHFSTENEVSTSTEHSYFMDPQSSSLPLNTENN